MRNNKNGITVTSITVYIILFFMFTTITTIISSRFNGDLFNDRGTAINITAINKLEYNLLKSAEESSGSELKIEDKKTTITFSNSDIYVFDSDKHIVYKNGGKLVDFLKEFKIIPTDDLIQINVKLNKYTNEITRDIAINTKVNTYAQYGLIVRFDGINNQGINKHSDVATTWKDLCSNTINANLSNNFTYDGVTNGWVENGLLLQSAEETRYAEFNFDEVIYPTMTVEITMTTLDQLGSEGNSYVYPLRFYKAREDSTSFYFGTRDSVALMYGSGNSTVLVGQKFKVLKDDTVTLTFVQNDLTARSLYFNGEYVGNKTNLTLNQLQFAKLRICSHENARYIVHSVRVYNRVLSADEIKNNYDIDMLRFGE